MMSIGRYNWETFFRAMDRLTPEETQDMASMLREKEWDKQAITQAVSKKIISTVEPRSSYFATFLELASCPSSDVPTKGMGMTHSWLANPILSRASLDQLQQTAEVSERAREHILINPNVDKATRVGSLTEAKPSHLWACARFGDLTDPFIANL